MKAGLLVGHQVELQAVVTEDMLAQFEGQPVHPLYATSAMVYHMEWAARQHILPYLEPGEEGVGAHVDVHHRASAPLGAKLRIQSTVTLIEPKRVTSQVAVWHENTLVGEGTVVQGLVQVAALYAGVIPAVSDKSQASEGLSESSLYDAGVDRAILDSRDGKTQFGLVLLKWESRLPCTRYDEWLVCEMTLFQEDQPELLYKAPFLLRYEVEELIQGLIQVINRGTDDFRSDFLESVLQVQAITQGSDVQVSLNLMIPAQEKGAVTSSSACMTVTRAALERFARQLEVQLSGFPSLL